MASILNINLIMRQKLVARHILNWVATNPLSCWKARGLKGLHAVDANGEPLPAGTTITRQNVAPKYGLGWDVDAQARRIHGETDDADDDCPSAPSTGERMLTNAEVRRVPKATLAKLGLPCLQHNVKVRSTFSRNKWHPLGVGGSRVESAGKLKALVELQEDPYPALRSAGSSSKYSDHAAILTSTRYSNTKRAKKPWRMPLSMLANKATVDELRKIRNETLAEGATADDELPPACATIVRLVERTMVFCKAKAETQYLAHVREKQQLAERLRRCDELRRCAAPVRLPRHEHDCGSLCIQLEYFQ
mgnify:CR=1 FL=1